MLNIDNKTQENVIGVLLGFLMLTVRIFHIFF